MFGASWIFIAASLWSFIRAEENGCEQTYCRTGRKGKPGKEGPYGQPGLKGDVGDIGPVGLTGPQANDMKLDMYANNYQIVEPGNYLYFYALNEQSSEFQVRLDPNGGSLIINKPGLFLASFIVQAEVSGGSPVVIELELDGNTVPFSRYSASVYGQPLVGQTIINVTKAGSILRVKNDSVGYIAILYTSGINASVNLVSYGEPGVNYTPNF